MGVAGYLLALAALGPFLSPIAGIWVGEQAIGTLGWRFGALGLLFGSQFYLMLALALAACAAALLDHRSMLLAVSIVAGLGTIGIAVGLPAFALDFFQLRRSMAPAAFYPYRLATMKAAALALGGIPVFFTIFVSGWQSARVVRGKDTAARSTPWRLDTLR